MEKIASFQVDHRLIEPGIYVSRADGDITTYDLRTRKPNTGDLMSHAQMHSTEHLFATFIRNSAIGESVIYFGPMGCQTGYYLLVRNAKHGQVLAAIKGVLEGILAYDGEMPGGSETECGNYRNLDVSTAKEDCAIYYEAIRAWSEHDLQYPA